MEKLLIKKVIIEKMISDQSCIVWFRGTGFGASYKSSIVCFFKIFTYILSFILGYIRLIRRKRNLRKNKFEVFKN